VADNTNTNTTDDVAGSAALEGAPTLGSDAPPGSVPVTVYGSYQSNNAMIVVGSQTYTPNPPIDNNYWYLVLDLTSLRAVASVVNNNASQIPTSIQPYVGNPQYLLIFVTLAIKSNHLPQGALYSFLHSTGAGDLLQRAEQIGSQINTGWLSHLSYILAATMNPADGSGFEEFRYDDYTMLTFQLMPINVDGKTIYAPIRT
jgi:hypothetical protein